MAAVWPKRDEICSRHPAPVVDIVLDTEFNDRVGGFVIDPISIAMVSLKEAQDYFYAVSSEFNQKAAQIHPFLAEQVLPKLPAPAYRQPNREILNDMKEYLNDVVSVTGTRPPRFVSIWAKSGGIGDFSVLNLWFEGRFLEFMQDIGIERVHFKDTYETCRKWSRSKLTHEIDPEVAHTALGDALYEREVLRACQAEMQRCSGLRKKGDSQTDLRGDPNPFDRRIA